MPCKRVNRKIIQFQNTASILISSSLIFQSKMVFDARCFVKQSTLFVIVCCYCSLPISWSILQENEAPLLQLASPPCQNRIQHQLQFPKYCCNYSSLRCNTSPPCQIEFTINCGPIKYCCNIPLISPPCQIVSTGKQPDTKIIT